MIKITIVGKDDSRKYVNNMSNIHITMENPGSGVLGFACLKWVPEKMRSVRHKFHVDFNCVKSLNIHEHIESEESENG